MGSEEVKRGWQYRIIETDNYGGDYPNESFHGPRMTFEDCEATVEIWNKSTGPNADRYYRTVPTDYKLQPGQEAMFLKKCGECGREHADYGLKRCGECGREHHGSEDV